MALLYHLNLISFSLSAPCLHSSTMTMNDGVVSDFKVRNTALPLYSCDKESLELLAATHVIYSYDGTDPPCELLDLTRQGKVGGIMLFGGNVDENLVCNIQKIQQAYKESPSYFGKPLLISTDQEGGYVKRIPGGPYESAKKAGEQKNPAKAAGTDGIDAGRTLKSHSINVNLAPVLGVYQNEDNFLNHFERSYSNDANVVSLCVSAFITSEKGIASTAKHFPGLGSAGSENTDEVPVRINTSLSDLREIDMKPFETAVSLGVDLVMLSWAFYDAQDGSLPAGLSRKWVQDELRQRVAFTGVTITDAIEADGLRSFGNDGQRAILASQAGMDLISAGRRNISQGLGIVKALTANLANGSLSLDDFRAATKRIQKLQFKLDT